MLLSAGRVACLALTAAVALAPPAAAQQGGRSTMVSSGAEGTVVVSLFDPDVELLTTPDLEPADLPAIARILSLSEIQAGVVRAHLERHLAAIEDLGIEIPTADDALGQPPMPGAAAGAGEGQNEGQSAGDLVRAAMKEAGIDPARLDSDLQMSLGIGIGMDTNPEDPDADPNPRVQVSLNLGAAPGVSIGAEEKKKLQAIAEAVAPKVEEMTRTKAIEDFRRQRDLEARGEVSDPMELQRLRGEEIRRIVRAYLADRARLRATFDNAVRAGLSEAQIAAWPAFERWARRNHTLAWGEIAMESVDVLAMAEQIMDERADAAAALAPQWEALELDLDAVLRRRNEHVIDAELAIDEACSAGDADEIERVARRSSQRRTAVRDANRRIVDAIAAAWAELPPEPIDEDEPWRAAFVEASATDDGSARGSTSAGSSSVSGSEGADDPSAADERAADAAMLAAMLGRPASLGDQFQARVRRDGYPRVWAVTPAVRAFRAVAGLELSPDVRAAATVMEADYRRQHAAISRRIEGVVTKWDGARPYQEVAGIIEALTGEDTRAAARKLGPSVAEALRGRLSLDQRVIQGLYGLLPSEVVATLPAVPEVEDLGPARVRIGEEFGTIELDEDD